MNVTFVRVKVPIINSLLPKIQDLSPLQWLSRNSIPRNSTSPKSVTQDEFQAIQHADSAVITQNSLLFNPQNVPLLEELSLDKLKKFELAAITLPYTSDMLLCRIPAYVKSTMVDKLAPNPIEKYSPEDNADWCYVDQSKRPSHPTTLKVI